MKIKIISVFLIISILIASVGTTAFATNELLEYSEANYIIENGYKKYEPINLLGKQIVLFDEPVISVNEAIALYPNAYSLIVKEAQKQGVLASINDPDFQSLAKSFAMFEGGSSTLNQECKNFAIFIDYYENIEINKKIISNYSLMTDDELKSIMPCNNLYLTEGNHPKDEVASNLYSNTYDITAVVNYASNWWNRTNNSDYSYYANYYGMDTSRNDYNDLDDGCSGQSNPARGWSDCADFVSQCILAGGVPQIKTGILLPHQRTTNWYYSNSKPSHTWGGANNFHQHWAERVGVTTNTSVLNVGDVVSVDFGNDGSVDHIMLIVESGENDSEKLLAAHSIDRYCTYYSNGEVLDFSIQYLINNGWNVYGYEISKVFE